MYNPQLLLNNKVLKFELTIDEAKSMVKLGLFVLFLTYNFGKAAKK